MSVYLRDFSRLGLMEEVSRDFKLPLINEFSHVRES